MTEISPIETFLSIGINKLWNKLILQNEFVFAENSEDIVIHNHDHTKSISDEGNVFPYIYIYLFQIQKLFITILLFVVVAILNDDIDNFIQLKITSFLDRYIYTLNEQNEIIIDDFILCDVLQKTKYANSVIWRCT